MCEALPFPPLPRPPLGYKGSELTPLETRAEIDVAEPEGDAPLLLRPTGFLPDVLVVVAGRATVARPSSLRQSPLGVNGTPSLALDPVSNTQPIIPASSFLALRRRLQPPPRGLYNSETRKNKRLYSQ